MLKKVKPSRKKEKKILIIKSVRVMRKNKKKCKKTTKLKKAAKKKLKSNQTTKSSSDSKMKMHIKCKVMMIKIPKASKMKRKSVKSQTKMPNRKRTVKNAVIRSHRTMLHKVKQ